MPLNRRDFLNSSALLAASLFIKPSELTAAAGKTKVRIGIIGVGLRGQNHLELALARPDVDVVAICDIDAGMLKDSAELVMQSGKKMPKVYTSDKHAYRKMLEIGRAHV